MRGEWRRNAVAGAGGGPYDPALMTPLPQLTTLDRFRLSSLDRYILRQCLSVTLFVTAALSAAVWLAQSLRLVDLIVNRGLAAEVFLYLALLILPRFIDIVLPIGAFIAVLFIALGAYRDRPPSWSPPLTGGVDHYVLAARPVGSPKVAAEV